MKNTTKHDKRKQMPVYTGVLKYFPTAILEVSKVSQQGNKQHHPNKELHWDKSKSKDHLDAGVRHIIDHSNHPIDEDGMPHLAKAAWRILAALQEYKDTHITKT